MRAKYRTQKRKPISEIEAKANYSGERSPYWDWNDTKFRGENQQGRDVLEDPLANPDQLDCSEALWSRAMSERGELMMEAVQEALPLLTPKQREALEAVQELVEPTIFTTEQHEEIAEARANGKDDPIFPMVPITQEAAAERLGVSRIALLDRLEGARRKVMKCYERLVTEENS